MQLRDAMLSEPGLELSEAVSSVGEAVVVLLGAIGEQGRIEGEFGEVNAEDVHGQPPSSVRLSEKRGRANLVGASWQEPGVDVTQPQGPRGVAQPTDLSDGLADTGGLSRHV